MSRERSDVQKSTSTRSIDNVGRMTPKVNAKFVNVKSKVGSVTNHKAGGGNVEIFSEKRLYNAQSKVGSLKNATHVAGGGNVQIENRKLDFSAASPKVGSKTNYQPAKSDVKIVSEKLTWQAKSKVGSMDNAAHKPAGGNVQILSQKLNWKAESKVGSKDNMNHRPGGGNVQVRNKLGYTHNITLFFRFSTKKSATCRRTRAGIILRWTSARYDRTTLSLEFYHTSLIFRGFVFFQQTDDLFL
nr:hypothetical protein F42G9.9 - Caenorhabditis elegans [Caenorhabditis elegans]